MGRGMRFDSKRTTNSCFSLDIHWLRTKGYIQKFGTTSGILNMRFRNSGRTFEAFTKSNDKAIMLTYKHNGEEMSYCIPVTYSDCNYGGERPWFRCPNTNCNKRVGKLFMAGKYFLCRHCYNLAYETQNMSGPFRLLERAQNIRERLGAKSLDTTAPFPSKPKGMHWKTYYKLKNKHDRTASLCWGMAAKKWGIAIG